MARRTSCLCYRRVQLSNSLCLGNVCLLCSQLPWILKRNTSEASIYVLSMHARFQRTIRCVALKQSPLMSSSEHPPPSSHAALFSVSLSTFSSSHSEAILCDVGEFHCHDGETCVPEAWLCDGEPDCPDASDETGESCKSDHSIHPHTECGAVASFSC